MSKHVVPLTIAQGHPAFAGHFPGNPIVPGVVLLDEVLHVIEQQLRIALSVCEVGSVKFLSPVRPGEAVQASFEVATNGSIRFDILCGERKVATGNVRTRDGT
jgi:3-hydroxymyristoyl/3-hydroxydecanoyl-(acyl carrier protein) dehydratase